MQNCKTIDQEVKEEVLRVLREAGADMSLEDLNSYPSLINEEPATLRRALYRLVTEGAVTYENFGYIANK